MTISRFNLRRFLPALVIALVIPGSACSSETQTDSQRLTAAIRRTEAQARSFMYQDAGLDTDVKVRGAIADDYAYKVRVSFQGVDAIDEVAVDDGLGMRFLVPEALDTLLARSPIATATVGAAVGSSESGTTLEALRSRRWVLDPSGAPDLTAASLQKLTVGGDPVLDALTVFAYLELAMVEAARVVRLNTDALDYFPDEDPFDVPKEGSSVIRYDLRPPEIASFASSASGELPDVRHFRRMSVYVNKGVIVQVSERVDVGTTLDRLIEALEIKVPRGASRGQLSTIAFGVLNQLRTTRRIGAIRIRNMSMEFVDLNKPVQIQLPSEAIEGSLNVIPNRGRAANVTKQPVTSTG